MADDDIIKKKKNGDEDETGKEGLNQNRFDSIGNSPKESKFPDGLKTTPQLTESDGEDELFPLARILSIFWNKKNFTLIE